MKKRQNKGFTLVEMLVATIVMVMVTLCVVSGVAGSQNIYQKSIFMSESDSVSTTLNAAIGDVLHYASFVEKKDDVIYFTNAYYAVKSGRFYTKDGRLYMTPTDTFDEAKLLSLLGKSAYSAMQIKDFKIDYTDGVYTGGYTIFHPKNNTLERKLTFTFSSLLYTPATPPSP